MPKNFTVEQVFRPKTHYTTWPQPKPWGEVDDSISPEFADKLVEGMSDSIQKPVGLCLVAHWEKGEWKNSTRGASCCNALVVMNLNQGPPVCGLEVRSHGQYTFSGAREEYIPYINEFYETLIHRSIWGDFFHYCDWGFDEEGCVVSRALFRTDNRPAPLLLGAMTAWRWNWSNTFLSIGNYIHLRKNGIEPLNALFFHRQMGLSKKVVLPLSQSYSWYKSDSVLSWKQQVGLTPLQLPGNRSKKQSAYKNPDFLTYSGTAAWGLNFKNAKAVDTSFRDTLVEMNRGCDAIAKEQDRLRSKSKVVPFFGQDILESSRGATEVDVKQLSEMLDYLTVEQKAA